MLADAIDTITATAAYVVAGHAHALVLLIAALVLFIGHNVETTTTDTSARTVARRAGTVVVSAFAIIGMLVLFG